MNKKLVPGDHGKTSPLQGSHLPAGVFHQPAGSLCFQIVRVIHGNDEFHSGHPHDLVEVVDNDCENGKEISICLFWYVVLGFSSIMTGMSLLA